MLVVVGACVEGSSVEEAVVSATLVDVRVTTRVEEDSVAGEPAEVVKVDKALELEASVEELEAPEEVAAPEAVAREVESSEEMEASLVEAPVATGAEVALEDDSEVTTGTGVVPVDDSEVATGTRVVPEDDSEA